jgi:hypothetical protein
MGIRSVASSGVHRTPCLFLFYQEIYARTGLWSIARACCIAAREATLGKNRIRAGDD